MRSFFCILTELWETYIKTWAELHSHPLPYYSIISTEVRCITCGMSGRALLGYHLCLGRYLHTECAQGQGLSISAKKCVDTFVLFGASIGTNNKQLLSIATSLCRTEHHCVSVMHLLLVKWNLETNIAAHPRRIASICLREAASRWNVRLSR